MDGLASLRSAIEQRDSSLDIKQDTFRLELTGQLYALMNHQGVNKADLAKRLGTTKSAVTRLLSGDRNMTADKITAVAFALGHVPVITFERIGDVRPPSVNYIRATHHTTTWRSSKISASGTRRDLEHTKTTRTLEIGLRRTQKPHYWGEAT